MLPRRIAALLLLASAAWLLWQGVEGVLVVTSRGSPLADALLNPPTSLWRIVAALLLLIGAGLAALGFGRTLWILVPGAVLFSALPAAMALLGADPSLWLDEAIAAAVVMALTLAVAALPRRRRSAG